MTMQYKDAMARISRLNCAAPQQRHSSDLQTQSSTDSSSLLPDVELPDSTGSTAGSNRSIDGDEDVVEGTLATRAMAVVKVLIPVKISLLVVKLFLILFFLEDIKILLRLWYMPLLGVLAACLANCVPIGGGIVYVPALAMLGSDMKLGVSFSVATMTIGNGIFGYLNWKRRDSSLLVWESIGVTVLPSSLGTVLSRWFYPPAEANVRTCFALFCFLLAVFVFFSVHKGGIVYVVHTYGLGISGQNYSFRGINSDEKEAAANNVGDATMIQPLPISMKSHEHKKTWIDWIPLIIISFLAGFVLVPNIAIGPSLTTFLGLILLGYQEKAAMVTGIVVGGWASIVPFFLHAIIDQDVPWDLWIMVLPGVVVGAWFAPMVQSFLGIENSLVAFGTFLLVTFVLFMTH